MYGDLLSHERKLERLKQEWWENIRFYAAILFIGVVAAGIVYAVMV